LANVFARSHCWAILLFGCRSQNTWGRAHGRRDNSIHCDSDFVAGFLLDRLAMRRRRFDAEKSKDETVIATSPTRPSSALASWPQRIPVRRGKPWPACPCQPNWRAGALVPRFPLTSGCGHDASFARAPRGCLLAGLGCDLAVARGDVFFSANHGRTDAKATPLPPPQS